MKKIITLFEKTEDQSECINKLRPENKWVLTNSKAYRKYDGTACMVKEGVLYRRYDVKLFKRKHGKTIETYTIEEVEAKLPLGAIKCQEPDEITGHYPHWIIVTPENGGQRMLDAFLKLDDSRMFLKEIFKHKSNKLDGTYEFCGPKVNANPENFKEHILVPHKVSEVPLDIHKKVDFDYLKQVLTDKDIEGIVFHEINGDRMCKIRKTDFGIKR